MSGYIVGIIIALALLAVILWKLGIFPFKKKPTDYDLATAQLPVKWPQTFASYHYTPQGVGCNFEAPVSQAEFDRFAPVIDMGIRNLLKGYPPSWSKKINHGDFIIGFIKPTATNQDGSPALVVNGIQTAGTILGYNTAFKPVVIVLPQQTNWEYLSYLMYSVWHEGEHDAELANDVGLFWSLLGAGDVHPHRPIENPELPPAPVGLMSRASTFVCGVRKDSAGR